MSSCCIIDSFEQRIMLQVHPKSDTLETADTVQTTTHALIFFI